MSKCSVLLCHTKNRATISLCVVNHSEQVVRFLAISDLGELQLYPSGVVFSLAGIGDYGLYYAFQNCTELTSVSFPELVSVGAEGLYYAFSGCTGLTGSVSFPALSVVSGGNQDDDGGLHYAFRNCTGLTSVSFPKLATVGSGGLYYAFSGCTGLTSVSFPELTSIGSGSRKFKRGGLGYAFSGCTGLTSVSFPKLTSVAERCLSGAFSGCTSLVEVHFPAALSGNSYCTADYMGCTNATVYFDL